MSVAARSKAGKVVAFAFGALAVIAIGAVCVYRDGNLHAEERTIARALDAGFVEKQATVNGATVNYAEGPGNGPALLLVHGQGMEWEDYASVLPELAKHYHVFAADCFGHGESEHDPALYSCKANASAIVAFANDVIGSPYAVSGHSSGGIIAAYVAASDPVNVTALILEDPPLFRVTPEEVQEDAGAFAWRDGYTVAHSFLQQRDVADYPAWYAANSYLFGLFGGLQPLLVEQTAAWCAEHSGEHAVSWRTGRPRSGEKSDMSLFI